MAVILKKKLGASDLLGPVNKIVKEMEIGDEIMGYGVAGVCTKLETGVSQFGEWTRFVGEFDAINYITGEIYKSEKTHVPSVLESVLLSGMEGLKGASKDLVHSTITELTSEVEFAFQVSIIRKDDDEKGGVNWEYVTTPKTAIKESSRISHLSAMLQLEAPKEAPKKAAKTK